MTMSIYDALEAWAEGRLPVERALALTHAADVAEMLVLCGLNGVARPLLTGPPPAEDDYPPEAIRLLAGMEPRRRPTGHVEDVPDPAWLALPPDERAAVLEREVRASRVTIGVEDLSDEEMAAIMASKPSGPDYSLDDLPDGGPRYPVEDGPGSSDRVELVVRVLIGMERSTVVVADLVTGAALQRDVVPHGGEAGAAAAAVSAAIRVRLQSQQPAMDYSHRLLPDGTPRRPLDDAETARHMRARGFSEAEVRHVLGHLPGEDG